MDGARADAAQAPGLSLGARGGPRARSRARPSCSPSRARRTCRWSRGSPAGAGSEIDPEARKSFEVALHAGTAAALLIGQRREIAAELAAFDARRAAVVALSFVPAGDRRLRARAPDRGPPRRTADDRRRARRRGGGDAGRRPPAAGARPRRRRRRSTGSRSGSPRRPRWCPGVSRNGATLTAARARRFTREHANLLSRTVALPVIVGRDGAQGRAPAPARGLAGARPGDGRRSRAPRSPRRSPRSG